MMRKSWLTGISTFAVAAGVWAALPVISYGQPLPSGIYVGEQDLGGMTQEEAAQFANDYIDSISDQKIILSIAGSEVETTAKDLGFHWSNSDVVEEMVKPYLESNLIKTYFNTKDLQQEPLVIVLETTMDQEAVANFVETQCSELITAPQNAALHRENGQFVLTPSVSGKEVDIEATKVALDQALAEGLEEVVRAEAIVKESEPQITTDVLATIKDELGSFSTSFSSSGVSRSKNLEVGSAKINGRILMPGEVLSGYECMAPFTQANGYMSAGAYENGQVVDSIGGGVCQISTTLYNAALRAEMEITQRQNHSMSIAYVKPSQDAAIAGTYKDLKFANPYDTPVYIEGYTAGKTITFVIYGKETRPANRTVEYISETLNVWDPGTPTEQVDATMAPGARKQVQSSHRGMKSRLWKCVYIDGVEKERTILHTDTYNASKAIVKVGPATAPASATDPVPETDPVPTPTEPVEPTEPATSAPTEPAGGDTGGPGMAAPGPAAPSAVPETAAAADPVSGPGSEE